MINVGMIFVYTDDDICGNRLAAMTIFSAASFPHGTFGPPIVPDFVDDGSTCKACQRQVLRQLVLVSDSRMHNSSGHELAVNEERVNLTVHRGDT